MNLNLTLLERYSFFSLFKFKSKSTCFRLTFVCSFKVNDSNATSKQQVKYKQNSQSLPKHLFFAVFFFFSFFLNQFSLHKFAKQNFALQFSHLQNVANFKISSKLKAVFFFFFLSLKHLFLLWRKTKTTIHKKQETKN